MASLFPVMICLEDKDCLVVGGGEVATRKVEDLLACDARVTVVAPQATNQIKAMAIEGRLNYQQRCFDDPDIEGMMIVISATNVEAVNQRIESICRRQGILVNVVDDPPKCDFFIPAVVRQGSLLISVSTEGKSPYLARHIKEEIQEIYGQEYKYLVEILGEARRLIKESEPNIENRKKIFANLAEGRLLQVIREQGPEQAREWVLSVYSSGRTESPDSTAGN